MRKGKISNAVIRRLPRYCRNLAALRKDGVERISSSALGKNMGLTASQIRQDLSCFGEFGQQGYGYNVENLYQEIYEILYLHKKHAAILVGAGNLGRALIQNFNFMDSGFQLEAIFDTKPALIGTEINGIPVLDAGEMEQYLKEHEVTIAVLTLPGKHVQQAADLLMDNGIRGIWNFTNIDFEVPEEHSDVVVESIHFSDSLQVLSYQIGE
ncbi:MAG: redox-sensing transcriptional repressor Rex [Oscillospiraceae bacterium]|nr:redox-sensing transcriptional repressor Rex [Oscillospiraceae bacterium]